MRFEFRIDDVASLIKLIEITASQIVSNPPAVSAVLRSCCFAMFRKLKVYAQEAFPNRQAFRDEMKRLEELISNA